jgi:hypothetical protein
MFFDFRVETSLGGTNPAFATGFEADGSSIETGTSLQFLFDGIGSVCNNGLPRPALLADKAHFVSSDRGFISHSIRRAGAVGGGAQKTVGAQQGESPIDRCAINVTALAARQSTQGGGVHKSVLRLEDVHEDNPLRSETDAVSPKLIEQSML